jgi:GxxExxY protein
LRGRKGSVKQGCRAIPLGCGFLEQIYLGALTRELRERGHVVDREVQVGVRYKGVEIGWQRLDMIVDRLLVVEVKSTTELHASARRQLRNYLCATRLELGLLRHFGETAQFSRLSGGPSGGAPTG